ncbi:MAG: GNAT family N-acetyltransferase [Peptococcaceae bacterium]|nr:GNAT family N-acetyltransferase [Peptococcaceae bacterium]
MLNGQKIWIRPLLEEDIDLLFAWYNDQEVNLWSSGAWPLNTLLAKNELLEKFLDDPDSGKRYGILNEDFELIGTLGFREMNVPARSATIHISIGNQAFWGLGYGSDALRTFIQFLFKQWNFRRLSIDTWDGNQRALKAYLKLGFQIEGRQRQACYVLGEYRDSILLGLLRDEFFQEERHKCLCESHESPPPLKPTLKQHQPPT